MPLVKCLGWTQLVCTRLHKHIQRYNSIPGDANVPSLTWSHEVFVLAVHLFLIRAGKQHRNKSVYIPLCGPNIQDGSNFRIQSMTEHDFAASKQLYYNFSPVSVILIITSNRKKKHFKWSVGTLKILSAHHAPPSWSTGATQLCNS